MSEQPCCPACGRRYPRPRTTDSVSYGRQAVVRPDQYHPSEWTPNPDGSWRSPRGRTYRDRLIIRKLAARRRQLKLPASYQEYVDSVGEPA